MDDLTTLPEPVPPAPGDEQLVAYIDPDAGLYLDLSAIAAVDPLLARYLDGDR